MGRLGIAVDGMGAHERASRVYRELAAIRRALGLVPRQFRGTGDERDRRRSVSLLGMAGAVFYQHRAGRDRGFISGSAFWKPRSSPVSPPRTGWSARR